MVSLSLSTISTTSRTESLFAHKTFSNIPYVRSVVCVLRLATLALDVLVGLLMCFLSAVTSLRGERCDGVMQRSARVASPGPPNSISISTLVKISSKQRSPSLRPKSWRLPLMNQRKSRTTCPSESASRHSCSQSVCGEVGGNSLQTLAIETRRGRATPQRRSR